MGMITSSNFKNSFVFCKSTEDEFIKRKWSEEFSILTPSQRNYQQKAVET